MYLMTKSLKSVLLLLNHYRSRCLFFRDFNHALKHLGFRDFVIKYIIDDDDDHDNDDKDDYSCNSVNFKVRTSRFCMELDINDI